MTFSYSTSVPFKICRAGKCRNNSDGSMFIAQASGDDIGLSIKQVSAAFLLANIFLQDCQNYNESHHLIDTI